jgi:hypothetical protein
VNAQRLTRQWMLHTKNLTVSFAKANPFLRHRRVSHQRRVLKLVKIDLLPDSYALILLWLSRMTSICFAMDVAAVKGLDIRGESQPVYIR